jgi:catechol 2,3-dioxygenase-like lactoylglutathione lyase family enzyme
MTPFEPHTKEPHHGSCKTVGVDQPQPVQRISAVTLLTVDMGRAVTFYHALGFHVLYGGHEAAFTSLRVGSGFLNLQLGPAGAARRAIWGRVVFWVDDVDAMYQRVIDAGFVPEGERIKRR